MYRTKKKLYLLYGVVLLYTLSSTISCETEEESPHGNTDQFVFKPEFIYKEYSPVVALASYDSINLVNQCFLLFPGQKRKAISVDLSDSYFDVSLSISHQSVQSAGCPIYRYTVEIRTLGNNFVGGSTNQLDVYQFNDSLLSTNWVNQGIYYDAIGMPPTRGPVYISIKSIENNAEHFGYIKLELANSRLFIQATAINQANSDRIIAGQMSL